MKNYLFNRLFFLFFVLFSLPQIVFAQSDSSAFSSLSTSETVLPQFLDRSSSFLDSSETIWNDLLQSLFQDTILLSDSARALFYATAQSVDSIFNSHLFQARTRLVPSEHSSLLLTEQIHREQARLADMMLTLYDSLSRAFDALLPPRTTARKTLAIDYKKLLDNLLETRALSHRFYFSTAYQSRSVWRGIDQNSGNGAYSLSATYQHRTGLFLSASALGLQGQPQALDQLSLTLGIDYNFFENVFLSLAYTRYHYSDSSVQARASINSDLTFWISYPTAWLTPSLTLIWAIGENKNDFFCDWEISRAFLLSQFSTSRLVLTPSIRGEYGTISNVRAFTRRTRPNQQPQTTVVQSSPFVLTNYNFSLSLLYSISGFQIVPEFLFVIPINVPSLTITRTGAVNPIFPTSRTFMRGGSAFGYFSVSISYSL
jgi:hypothetical protein